jgi:type IV secretion system protein VirB10
MAAMQSGGFDPNMAGMRPGAFNSAATASETTGQQIVGEPVDNRRGNQERGPRPGEVLLPTGTVLSAVLDMDMISDYEGPWRGILVRDVYDVEKNYILLPKGTRFTGQAVRIKNINEPIQARMAMGVKWAILPNGNRIDFSKMSALDHAGVSALKDQVNYHIFAQLAGLTAYAVLGAAPSLRLETDGGDLSSKEQALSEMTSGLRNQFGSMAERYLNLVPTITVRAGTPFKVFIEDDLYIKPWMRVDDTIYTASY